MLQGIELNDSNLSKKVMSSLYDPKIIFETCGPKGTVIKLMPPLTITQKGLDEGFYRIQKAFDSVMNG